MNSKYLLLQALLLISVFVNLFIDKNLFLKILLVILLFLYGLLILPEFKCNRERYLFSATGFVVIAILFLFVKYTTGTTYVLVLSCLLVGFMYLSRVLFSKTFGVVLESSTRFTKVKIADELFSYGRKYELRSSKKYPVDSLVLIELDKSVLRKPISIIKQIDKDSKKPLKNNKITKKPKKTIKKKKK